MSTGTQASDAPHRPLVRVTLLWDLLNQAKDRNQLCEWVFHHASSGQCPMYLPVPKGYFVLCSSHTTFDSGLGASTRHAERPRLPEIGVPLLEVKFVRLSPRIVEKVAQQAASKNMFQQHPICDDRFPGGLSMPEHSGDVSGPYEDLPTSVELRIKSASMGATSAWECMEIDPTQVFIDNSVHDHIRPLLDDAPHAAIDVNETRPNPATVTPSNEGREASTAVANTNDTSSTASIVEPQQDANDTEDPYGLKGQADGVYALYRTAERCAQDPVFGQETNPKKRRAIAHEIFSALLHEMEKGSAEERARQQKLKVFFGKERLGHALHYIDPEYHPNNGRPSSEWVDDWPTELGKALTAKPDVRRQDFVKPMLAILIGGVHHWIALKAKPHAPGPAKQWELGQWLEAHGLAAPKVRRTGFEVIAWSGNGVPKLPKSAAPSPSRAPVSGGRRASRRRV